MNRDLIGDLQLAADWGCNEPRDLLLDAIKEIKRLRAATNQCRLAFAGCVSVDSAVRALDSLGDAP